MGEEGDYWERVDGELSSLPKPLGFICNEGRDACWHGAPECENPYPAGEPAHRIWKGGWRQAEDLLSRVAADRKRREMAELWAPSLEFLRLSFDAGCRGALADALAICHHHELPLPGWTVAAASATAAEASKGAGAKATRRYSANRREMLRFLAVAGIREFFEKEVQRAVEDAGCSRQEAEAKAAAAHGRKPTWANEEIYQRAADILLGTEAYGGPDVIKKSYAKVKADIEDNGERSQYMAGIDVHKLSRSLLRFNDGGPCQTYFPPPVPGDNIG